MNKPIYVIGHRNPDTDSIASAIAYAALKSRTGMPEAVAAMAGEPNPQTRYILDRLGIADPLYLADVHPKVRDIVNREPVTVAMKNSAYEALEKFHCSGVRVLPVLDNQNTPQGSLSLRQLSENYLLTGTDRQREFSTTLAALAATLAGRFITGTGNDEVVTLKLFIGAMSEDSFSDRIQGHNPADLLIMTGNRRTIHQSAIERGVKLLVITGGHHLDDDLRKLADSLDVPVLLTPHDTATAAWLSRLSTPVHLLANRKFTTIGDGEPVVNLRRKMLSSGESSLFAVNDEGALVGVATKSSLMAANPYALILVDHNELGQAVPGAEELEIIEVIDHHKLGNSHTITPITFITAPVGSTCTLVAGSYREQGLQPETRIASLLLAGILSDTVILKSPTTTGRDRETVTWLEELSGLSAEEFGRDIFAASSSLKNYGSPQHVVEADFKLFTHEDKTIGIGQVEVIGFAEFSGIKTELLAALGRIKQRENLFIAGLMVTDITAGTTLFLVEGHTRIAHVMEYPQLEPHLYELKNVMSRKKQMVPHLMKVLAKA